VVFEAPSLVAGLGDVAVVGQAIKKCGCHLGIARDSCPLAEGEVGRDDNRGALTDPADQMEKQLATGLSERQIAEFVQNDEVETGEIISEPPLTFGTRFRFEAIDQIDSGEEAAARACTNALRAIAIARWVLPAPVLPTNTTFRC